MLAIGEETTTPGVTGKVPIVQVIDETRLAWIVEFSKRLKTYRKWSKIGDAFY